MREQFEKLPEIAILLSDGEVYFDESQKKYLCIRQDDGGVERALGLAWYTYQEQQRKIDSLEPIRKAILWHVEDSELYGINNDYDQGWYDCLKMISKYVLEDK